jgi:enoyl-CoA hydratase/carnithine racemase
VERPGAKVAWLEVSEPRRLNIVGTPALESLSRALVEVAGVGLDGGLRALVLRGGGERAFIGGADLRELSALDEESARVFITRLHGVCRSLRELPVPVIAAIRGYCLGAGLEVAASCDMRVATTDSVFGMPEVLVGIPSVIEAALLPQLVGWGRAREMMLTGRTYDASEALAMGLVEETVPPDSLGAAVERRLEWVGRASPRALAAQKELFMVWERGSLADGIAAGVDALAAAYRWPDARERMREFLLRKREP